MHTAPTRTARPRAALYLRLSESNEADRTESGDSASIGRQEKDLRDLCAREGWHVDDDHVYVDDGLSGRMARKNADAAATALRSGDVDVLVVWKWDRWSRQGLPALAALIDAIDARPDALFVAMHDGLRSDAPAWRLIASVLAEVARMEAENTSLRVSRAMRENRAAGRFTGGPTPIGYRSAPNPKGPGSILVLDPAESAAMTDAANSILAGASLYSVTRDLNASGVRPRRAARWSTQAVTQALTGTSIVGRVKVDGKVLMNPDGTPRQVFDPAIPVHLWRSVGATLAERRASRPSAGVRPRQARSRLLSGLATCSGCGAPLYVRTSTAGTQYYRCTAMSNGRECPASASVKAETIEAYVEQAVLRVAGPFALLRPVAVEADAADLADVLEAIEMTRAAFHPGADFAALAARMERLGARRDALEAAAAAAPAVIRLEETGETFGELWGLADGPTRREHLARVLERVEVRHTGRRGRPAPLSDERVSLVWSGADDPESDYLRGQWED